MMRKRTLVCGDGGDLHRFLVKTLTDDPKNDVCSVEILTQNVGIRAQIQPSDDNYRVLEPNDFDGLARLIAEFTPSILIDLMNVENVASPRRRSLNNTNNSTQTSGKLNDVALQRSRIDIDPREHTSVSRILRVRTKHSSDPEAASLTPDPADSRVQECVENKLNTQLLIDITIPIAFGPDQPSDDFFPAIIATLLNRRPLSLANSRRNWAYIEDIVDGIICLSERGECGQHYTVGCDKGEQSDIAMAELICDQLDQLLPRGDRSYREQLKPISSQSTCCSNWCTDQPITRALGWRPLNDFHCAVAATVRSYVNELKIHIN